MRNLIARWLGLDQRLSEVLAQRDANRELAIKYAQEAGDLKAQHMKRASAQSAADPQAAEMVRDARLQLNLKNSRARVQAQLLAAEQLLREGEHGGD